MNHIKLFEEFFWNKDTDIGDKILKGLDDIDPYDIEHEEGSHLYKFLIGKTAISSEWDCGLFDFVRPSGYYIIKADNIDLKLSWLKAMRIYKKVKSIVSKNKKNDEEFIKNDIRSKL